jgi:hypothetical protein
VAVVPAVAVLQGLEFVVEGVTGSNGTLRYTIDSIRLVRM